MTHLVQELCTVSRLKSHKIMRGKVSTVCTGKAPTQRTSMFLALCAWERATNGRMGPGRCCNGLTEQGERWAEGQHSARHLLLSPTWLTPPHTNHNAETLHIRAQLHHYCLCATTCCPALSLGQSQEGNFDE